MLTRLTRVRNEEGFTLIELLVVVAIIALLTAFAVPKLFDAINKSKKAPGQADMETISGALERFYMENTAYPTTDMATVKSDLFAGYVKAGTTFKNGFGKGYLYQTNATGGYYIFVDPRNNTGTVKVVCNLSAGTPWQSNDLTINVPTSASPADLFVNASKAVGPTNADVAAGCYLFTNTAAAPFNATSALDAQIVTN